MNSIEDLMSGVIDLIVEYEVKYDLTISKLEYDKDGHKVSILIDE